MPVRNASAQWEGDLKSGKGVMRFADFEGPYTFARFEEQGDGTDPEELVGASLAGCFSMALANKLAQAGHPPTRVATDARVHLDRTDAGPTITTIELSLEAEVPGIDRETFDRLVEETRTGCPISRALGGVEKKVDAKLLGA
ncbi:MAG TPA: OsmC family peroxiredoxin [Actinomycetota bacterium]|nr:OsmC family peroxiredoxin [Actinomycetota bacterium]